MMVKTEVPSTHYSSARRRRVIARGIVGGAATLAFATSMLTPSFAAAGDTSADTTIANVDVTTAITLAGLTPTFTMTGIPGADVTGPAAVTATVETNNLAGYAVTVSSRTATMVAATAGNTDSIPIALLTVTNSANVATPMTVGPATVTVATKATRSIEGGDPISDDYAMAIPFVDEDTYTATLDYIATTL